MRSLCGVGKKVAARLHEVGNDRMSITGNVHVMQEIDVTHQEMAVSDAG
jgi:hypothetical protein